LTLKCNENMGSKTLSGSWFGLPSTSNNFSHKHYPKKKTRFFGFLLRLGICVWNEMKCQLWPITWKFIWTSNFALFQNPGSKIWVSIWKLKVDLQITLKMKVKVIVKVIVQSAPSYPTIFVLNIFLFNRDVSSYLAVN